MRTSEIISKNLEFYYSTYIKDVEKTIKFIFAVCTAISGLLLWKVKNWVLYICYFNKAGLEGVEEDVMDYVNKEIGIPWLDFYTLIILIGTLLVILSMAVVGRVMKNYEFYKKRAIFTFLPLTVSLLEITAMVVLFYRRTQSGMGLLDAGERIMCIVILAFYLVIKLLLGRLTMTLDLRRSDSRFLQMADLLTDFIIEHL